LIGMRNRIHLVSRSAFVPATTPRGALSQLRITSGENDEIAHHYDASTGDKITSTGNCLHVVHGPKTHHITLPVRAWQRLPLFFRLTRRALRLDKANVLFNFNRDGVVAVYASDIYFYDLDSGQLSRTGRLRQCRNVLHCGIAVSSRGIFLGEYGANPDRGSVPVWRSHDDGRTWSIAYEFPPRSIRHLHGVYNDPYSSSLWITTGDFQGECYLFEVPDHDFSRIVRHGDGSQKWRPVGIFFESDRLIWAMDSQLETSHLQVFDRATGALTQGRAFPGPVWYSKRFRDGSAVLQTTVEVGEGVKSRYSHLFFSRDLIDWVEVARFPKDILPVKYFKSGVIGFAEGAQSPENFPIFGEALRGLDGRIKYVSIVSE
jgi:hypothetical protein